MIFFFLILDVAHVQHQHEHMLLCHGWHPLQNPLLSSHRAHRVFLAQQEKRYRFLSKVPLRGPFMVLVTADHMESSRSVPGRQTEPPESDCPLETDSVH